MFPLLYHTHHRRHPEDLPFWLNLAARQGDPILELGCGTGRVLMPLAAAGHTVVGLDKDLSMLAFLRQHLPARSKDLQLFQGDLTAFHLGRPFPLILLACNTYSTLTALERRSALDRVRQHLQAGGIFAASLANPALLRRLPRRSESEFEESFLHPLDGEPVQVSSGWERTKEHFVLTWHYDHLLPNGKVDRTSSRVRHYLEDVNTYLDEFNRAKLAIFRLLGDFDSSPYQASAPNLIFLLRKTNS